MEDFHPAEDRLKEARKADVLARLREAAPGADRLAAAQSEPDPVAVHLGILKKNFPTFGFLHRPWGRGLPDLRALAGLAELRAYFSRGKKPAPPRRDEPTTADGVAELTRHFRQR